LPFANGERKNRLIALRAISRICGMNRRLAAGRLEIDFKKPFDLLAKLPAEARGEAPRRLIQYGGVCWTKSELFLTKIRTAKFDCRAKLGRDKNFSARAGKKEGGWGEGIFARPRFRRFFFRRRNFSYFALRNAPPRSVALVPPTHTRATIRNSLKFVCLFLLNLVSYNCIEL